MHFCFLAGCSVPSISCVEQPDLSGQIGIESCLKIASPLLQSVERRSGSAEIGWDGSDLLLGAIPGRSWGHVGNSGSANFNVPLCISVFFLITSFVLQWVVGLFMVEMRG